MKLYLHFTYLLQTALRQFINWGANNNKTLVLIMYLGGCVKSRKKEFSQIMSVLNLLN